MTSEAKSKILFLLSGPIASGKSTLLECLEKGASVRRISTGSFLLANMEKNESLSKRSSLQDFGDRLDLETNYSWIYWDLVFPAVNHVPNHRFWALDSVRKLEQVKCLREFFQGRVIHIHLTAPEFLLEQRYVARRRPEDSRPYSVVRGHPNEIAARRLMRVADFVLSSGMDSSINEQAEALIRNL